MKAKLIASMIGVASVIASASSFAAPNTSVASTTVDGVAQVIDGCTITGTYKPGNPLLLKNVANGVVFGQVSVQNSCSSKIYGVGVETDSQGLSVMTNAGDNKQKANYMLVSGDYDPVPLNGKLYAVSKNIISGGSVNNLNLGYMTNGDYGLPKAAGDYKFQMEIGYWND